MDVSNHKYVFFWGGIYSQWYPCKFTVDEVEYNCTEQYMMHQKALLFGDIASAELIMSTDNPRTQKQLGRKVANFNKEIWESHCLSIVYTGNLAKFTQNTNLGSQLLLTGSKIIVEASPEDRIWGIGLDEWNVTITDPKNWRGFNLLGLALMLVRNEFINNAK